ncbi:MAG TPA: hypothetical protein VKZ18_04305 [Polyangia bacterium]|nr:hypothetical protein [Polyangia bacterium]
MRSLVPCSSCQRHVAAEATECPFCGAALEARPDPRPCSGPCAGRAFPRMNRVAVAAAGAALLCASCLGATSSSYGVSVGTPEPDAGAQSADGGQK